MMANNASKFFNSKQLYTMIQYIIMPVIRDGALLTFAVCIKYDITDDLSSKFTSLTISLVTHVVI